MRLSKRSSCLIPRAWRCENCLLVICAICLWVFGRAGVIILLASHGSNKIMPRMLEIDSRIWIPLWRNTICTPFLRAGGNPPAVSMVRRKSRVVIPVQIRVCKEAASACRVIFEPYSLGILDRLGKAKLDAELFGP